MRGNDAEIGMRRMKDIYITSNLGSYIDGLDLSSCNTIVSHL